MARPVIFLDVDGVLLGYPSPGAGTYQLANHAVEFLRFLTAKFEVVWATTQCRDGDPAHVISYIAEHAPQTDKATITELVREIRPTTFNVCKTELFPLATSNPWIWIDDSPLAYELSQLRSQNLIDRWMEVNTMKRPDDLLRAMKILQADWTERQ